MTLPSSSDDALRFYYHGFYAALVRYRILTLAGWLVTLVGSAGLLATCQTAGGDLLGFAVPVCAVGAGLALVQQSVAALDGYVRVPFPRPDPDSSLDSVTAAIEESARLMGEIDRGGWQEAYKALGAVKAMAAKYGLPELR